MTFVWCTKQGNLAHFDSHSLETDHSAGVVYMLLHKIHVSIYFSYVQHLKITSCFYGSWALANSWVNWSGPAIHLSNTNIRLSGWAQWTPLFTFFLKYRISSSFITTRIITMTGKSEVQVFLFEFSQTMYCYKWIERRLLDCKSS